MQKINAIDLDQTLIPFDSFRYLILLYLKQKTYLTPVVFYILFRKLRLISKSTFKYKVLIILRQDRHYQNMIHDLTDRIMSTVRPEIMEIIEKETSSDTVNVLVSASPSDYIVEVAKKLNWPYLASEIINGKFIHCYGKQKRNLVLKHYPKQKYVYNFAISDSLSDKPLLAIFRKCKLILK